jgi:Lipocalin-like domain
MNRRTLLNLSAITALGLAVSSGSAIAQTKSLKDQLVGTWTAVSWEQDVPNGPKFQRYGANPKGVTVFDANGRFFSMTARPDLPKIASNSPSTPTPEEAKAIVGGAIGSFGTYTVDEAAKVITLRYEASSFPNQVGTDQKRLITSLTGDELKFQNPTAISGGQIYYGFKRAK